MDLAALEVIVLEAGAPGQEVAGDVERRGHAQLPGELVHHEDLPLAHEVCGDLLLDHARVHAQRRDDLLHLLELGRDVQAGQREQLPAVLRDVVGLQHVLHVRDARVHRRLLEPQLLARVAEPVHHVPPELHILVREAPLAVAEAVPCLHALVLGVELRGVHAGGLVQRHHLAVGLREVLRVAHAALGHLLPAGLAPRRDGAHRRRRLHGRP
mmetsp:Transcript_13125/g.39094  ORF Transcript_13125/g.39094 Transcript_13125/m.39094 type:complete len:212 (-) Transcript_13125:81-716(-)